MRTIYPVILVLCIGAASIMWAGSGIGDVYGESDPVQHLESDTALNETAEELPEGAEDNQQGFVSRILPDDDSFLGLITTGAQSMVKFATSVLLIQRELMRLGLPDWFAIPVGTAAQAIGAVGFIQFITGRRYE